MANIASQSHKSRFKCLQKKETLVPRVAKISIGLISQVRNWPLVFDTQATGVCISLPETQSGFI